ncbi:MAG: hypothetical protein COZ18_09590 [Flexibacter sp. CG_4_10_14_3_um_filter_32_15]|nr:MAG: hypothetical protein COZ18_09590 [Flexibacter sp. CG_4_10_14_3_um_filter_32_15]
MFFCIKKYCKIKTLSAMIKFIKILLLTLLVCLYPFFLQAQCTFTSTGDGDWTDPATWTNSCEDPNTSLPGEFDAVIIQPTHIVTLNSGTTIQVASLTLANQGNNGATLTVNGSSTHLIVGPTGGTTQNVFIIEGKSNFIVNDALVTVTGALKMPNNGNAIASGAGTVGYLLVENCARAGGNDGIGETGTGCVNAGNFVDGPLVYCVRCPPTDCSNDPTVGVQTQSPDGCRLVLLPITLVKLEAVYKSDKGTSIDWATINEIDNDYFEIEHSITGENFESIGIVNGFGNKESLTEYSFLDANCSEGINYYRLKQVDYNGKFSYSPTIFTRSKHLTHSHSTLIYPNPNEGTNLSLRISNPSKIVSIEIFNAIGKSVYFSDANQKNNTNDLQIKFNSKLPKGIYITKILTKEGISMERFLVE